MSVEVGVERIRALGFSAADAEILWAHFDDAERRGKPSHGHARIAWLETLEGLDPAARPERVEAAPGFERWHGRGAVGYLTLAAVVAASVAEPPSPARLVVAERCFPTGHLGYWVRQLAESGLVGVLTATSPARLGPPGGGGPALAGTNPLAIGVPSSDGEQAHKAFALAVGLQLFVDALVREPAHGAVLLVARPESDPVPALRAAAAGAGVRLPGDA